MVESCPRCGLHFHRIPGHWLGSWFLNIVVVQACVVGVFIVGVAATYPDTPMGPIIAVGFVVAVVVPFLFFPFSRTIWTAIDLAMRPLTFDEGVPPGFELEPDVGPVPDLEHPPGHDQAGSSGRRRRTKRHRSGGGEPPPG